MEQNFNRRIETDLDLNGPHLAVSSQPSDATVAKGATQTFSVTASATFPGNTGADDEGSLTYQWYVNDDGNTTKLTDEGQYSGTTTATLTVGTIESPENNGNKYYCVIDYIAAEKYAEGGKGTGHPINGAITSDSATLTVTPYIVIGSQPTSVDREYGVDGEIGVTASLSDDSYSNDIGYQWYMDGSAVSDGRETTTRIERGTVIDIVEEDQTITKRHFYSFSSTYYYHQTPRYQSRAIPSTASNIKVTIAGGAGGKGGEDAPWNCSGSGGVGRQGEFTLNSNTWAGTTIKMYSGRKGSDGIHGAGQGSAGAGGGYGGWAGGGNGGDAGGSGASGGGGGGGGASAVYHESLSTPVIVAGGGGGGGGCSNYNQGGRESQYGGRHAKNWAKKSTSDANGGVFNPDGGHNGGPCYCSDGAGGGGAGAGAVESSPPDTENVKFTVRQSAGASNKIYLKDGSTTVATFDSSNTGTQTETLTVGKEYNLTTWSSCRSAYIEAQGGGSRVGLDDCKPGGDNDYNDLTVDADDGEFYGMNRNTTGKFKISAGSGQIGGASRGGTGGCDGQRGGESGEGGKSFWHYNYVRGTRADGTPNNNGNNGQGYVKLSYSWYEDETTTRTVYKEVEREIENSIPQNLDISGTKGSIITLKADYDTVRNLYCSLQSPQSSNSPLTTDTVQFASYSNLADKNLYLEQVFWDNGTATATLSTIDLNNGPLELALDSGTSGKGLNIFTCFYTTEDMYITLEMQGGTGETYTQPAGVAMPPGGFNYAGGRGGYGRLDIKTKANREFTVAGLFNGINNPYLYYKEYLVAVVGEGGGGGCFGQGGRGGGMSGGSGWGFHGEGPKGGVHGYQGGISGAANGKYGTANGGGGAPSGRQSYGDPNNLGPCYGTPTTCTYISNVGYIGGHYAGQGWNSLACDSNSNRFCDGVQWASYGGRVKIMSKNNINGRSDVGYRDVDRKIKMRDGTFLNNTATIARGFADIEGAFIATAGGRRSGHVNDGLGGRGGNGALGGEGSAGGKGGGGGSGFLADLAYNPNIGAKEFDGVKFFSRANSGKIDDTGAKVKITLDTTGNY